MQDTQDIQSIIVNDEKGPVLVMKKLPNGNWTSHIRPGYGQRKRKRQSNGRFGSLMRKHKKSLLSRNF